MEGSGFDCSGLSVEMLKATGLIERGSDYTAHGLYKLFKAKEVSEPYEGCLIFWGDPKRKIYHVEIAIDEIHAVGASGGVSRTITMKDAIRHNAFVKVRPISKGRKKPCAYVDPFK